MDKETIGLGLKLLGALVVIFALHFVAFTFTDFGQSFVDLGYSLVGFYGFEFLFSIGILLAMVGIKTSMPNSLGYVFLGFITVRLLASYLFVREGLDSENVDELFKYNFLIVVLIYLGGDAFVAYHILNKKVS
ncbi:hypothetical protein SAMN04488018_102262 [Myroides marinus]|uniref:Uncharacterized protein n=1 Tax=Myroides marinus TaxID=703342 RepID=A0A1H6SA73_9FLAO|nr:hypothetical protein [Myroides marinus]SEI61667.1 hypothetical protein SAMN04488018_102262 [Myroides marinus]